MLQKSTFRSVAVSCQKFGTKATDWFISKQDPSGDLGHLEPSMIFATLQHIAYNVIQ